MIAATRYTARWVLPVSTRPIAHGAVLVDTTGRIVAVGPDAAVPRPADARNVELETGALLPGLVNVHAHPELTPFRGGIEDLPFPDWIAVLLRRRRLLAPEDWAAAARAGCVEAVRAGITTIAATETSAASLDALREAGLRGIVFQEAFGPEPEHARDALAELRRKVESLRTRATELVRVGVSPHAPYTVSDALFRRIAEYARAEALPLAVHAAESDDEDAYVMSGMGAFAERLAARGIDASERGSSTIELLDRLGVLALRPLLIHCVRVGPEDITRIAAAGASVAHCPAANARHGHGIAPLGRLLDAGIRVGLGTDSVASNNRMDLLEEARLAQLFRRAQSRRPDVLPAERLLRMVTLDGARALGFDGTTGSLEPGMDADLCGVDFGAPHVVPVHDPVTALIHSARASDVVLTVVRGRILYSGGVVHSLDVPSVLRDLERAARRLRTRVQATLVDADVGS